MIWSKTTSSEKRVSARIAVHVLGRAAPQSHHRDPTLLWITGLRPYGLSVDPVTNLKVLTSTQSNDAARPKSRLGFAHETATRVNLAQLALPEKMGGGEKELGSSRGEGEWWMEGYQGEQLRRVVRMQRVVWSSVVTQQLQLGNSLSFGRF